MKTLNVRLRLSSHPVFRDMVAYPPEGVNYSVLENRMITPGLSPVRTLKKLAWSSWTRFSPPMLAVERGGNDLIHSCHGMLLKTSDPWVIDAEHVLSLANFNLRGLRSGSYRRKIRDVLAAPNCRAIMAWTEAARKSVEYEFADTRITGKLKVVTPSIAIPDVRRKNGGPFKMLVVSRFFYEKGGKFALDVFDELSKKYDVEMDILARVPDEVKRKYANERRIRFVDRIFTETGGIGSLFSDFYSNADVLLHLSMADTFGLAYLEAMGSGLPVVATSNFSTPEMVTDGKSGLLVEPPFRTMDERYRPLYHRDLGNYGEFIARLKQRNSPFVSDAASKVASLIENPALARRLGSFGMKEVREGRLSVMARNAALRRVYEEALG